MRHLLLLALLLPFAASAQTVQNPSFESAVTLDQSSPSAGTWGIGSIPNWTGSGTFGVWKPPASEFTSMCDGSQIAYANGVTLTQDLGPVQAGTYSFSVCAGNRGDGYNASATYTVSLLVGSTSLCSQSGSNSGIPSATFKAITQSCTVTNQTGDLIVSLGCAGTQCDFDNVKVTFTPPASPPNIATFTFPVQLTTCTKCDGTDDQGATALGLLAGSKISISSGSSVVCSGVLNANAQMSCSAGIDISPAMVPLSLTVTSGDGSTSYTDSQQILGILFMGRNLINVVALFDATNLQPRGLRVWSQ